MRQCYLQLLSFNVGIHNVRAIINCLLGTLVNRKVKDVQSVGLLSNMLVELKAVSALHLAEELTLHEDAANTLHSDGTTKFGQKYASYQVATCKQTFSLGMVEAKCGSGGAHFRPATAVSA